MALLWIALALAGVIGGLVLLRVLAAVLTAARQLQRNVATLSQSVNAELSRLEGTEQPGGDMSQGDPIDEAPHR
ncbi:MAG: hypothetical protein ACR2HY_00845 [Acidimicrobiales bacterium]